MSAALLSPKGSGERSDPAQRIRIHGDGCWRFPHHHECAVKKIREMEVELNRLRSFSDSQADALDYAERGWL